MTSSTRKSRKLSFETSTLSRLTMETVHKVKPKQRIGIAKIQIDNPFKEPKDNSDIILKVGEYILHVHSWVLAHYSLSFRKWLSTNYKGPNTEINVKESSAAHVIELVKFFYPQLHHSLNEKTNFKELLRLCQILNVQWLTSHIANFIKSKLKSDSLDEAKLIWYLHLADEYKLNSLRNKLLDYKYNCHFKKLQKQRGFQRLHDITKFELIKIRLEKLYSEQDPIITRIVEDTDPSFALLLHSTNTGMEEFQAISNFLDGLIYTNTESMKSKQIENPFATPDDGSDIVLIVDGCKLHLHSYVLCHNSPVFKDILKTNNSTTKKEILLKGKKLEHVIEWIKFFYADKFQKIEDNAPFEDLLALCHEFQVLWLKNDIQEYLMSRTQDLDTKRLKDLYTADTYNLNEMREKLLTGQYEPFHKLSRSTDFKQLTNPTKYKVARKRIKVRFDLQNQNGDNGHHECEAVITLLDEIFKTSL